MNTLGYKFFYKFTKYGYIDYIAMKLSLYIKNIEAALIVCFAPTSWERNCVFDIRKTSRKQKHMFHL